MRHLRYVLVTHGRHTSTGHRSSKQRANAAQPPTGRPAVASWNAWFCRGIQRQSLVFGLSAGSGSHARTARFREIYGGTGSCTKWAADISCALSLDHPEIRRLFASALQSASFAKVKVAQPWISTAIKAPQRTRCSQVVVLAPLLVRRWHILRDGAGADAGRTKIALRGHRLS